MAKTNAERQAEFAARMRDMGFTQRLFWTDSWGRVVTAPRRGRAGDLGPQLTERQMAARLRQALDGLDETAAAQVRAGIADYADFIRRTRDREMARIQPLLSNTGPRPDDPGTPAPEGEAEGRARSSAAKARKPRPPEDGPGLFGADPAAPGGSPKTARRGPSAAKGYKTTAKAPRTQ